MRLRSSTTTKNVKTLAGGRRKVNKQNNTATKSPVGKRRSSRKAKSIDSPKSNESKSESARISSAKFTEIQQCVKVKNAPDDSSGSDSDHVTASIASAKSTKI